MTQETIVKLADGCTLRSGVYDDSNSDFSCGEYVRLCSSDGTELLYWDQEEWKYDPALVMGAIMNSAAGMRLKLCEHGNPCHEFNCPNATGSFRTISNPPTTKEG